MTKETVLVLLHSNGIFPFSNFVKLLDQYSENGNGCVGNWWLAGFLLELLSIAEGRVGIGQYCRRSVLNAGISVLTEPLSKDPKICSRSYSNRTEYCGSWKIISYRRLLHRIISTSVPLVKRQVDNCLDRLGSIFPQFPSRCVQMHVVGKILGMSSNSHQASKLTFSS